MESISSHPHGHLIKTIPENEVVVTSARSSGPGGQNVNKRETKVVLRWPIAISQAFTEQEKSRLFLNLASRINAEGELMMECEDERSREQNERKAFERLNDLVIKALTPKKKRRKTKPTFASQKKRQASKTYQSQKKARRNKTWE